MNEVKSENRTENSVIKCEINEVKQIENQVSERIPMKQMIYNSNYRSKLTVWVIFRMQKCCGCVCFCVSFR